MPDPEKKETKREEVSESEQVVHDTRAELLDFQNRMKVESIINELSLFINVFDLKKKNDFVDYICTWKLWSKENKELESVANRIIYGLPLWLRTETSSFSETNQNTWQESTSFRLENKLARKLKYILDNYWKGMDRIISDIEAKELQIKTEAENKLRMQNTSKVENESKKEEKWILKWVLDWLKDACDYWADKLSDLWNFVTKWLPSSIVNWVKNNLFSPEKQKNTENINEIYKNLKLAEWTEKPDFLPFYLAMQWYNKEKRKLWNSKYLTVVDYSKPVSKNRLYIINMQTLTVENCVPTWHGKNSWNTQTTSKFSNTPNSKQTSIGFFRTPSGLKSNSKWTWKWLFLNWMEYSNNNAGNRWIAVHPVWSFFYSRTEKGHKAWDSTSEGCITIRSADNPGEIMNKIKGDSLIYSYYPDMTYLTKSVLIK